MRSADITPEDAVVVKGVRFRWDQAYYMNVGESVQCMGVVIKFKHE